MNRSRTNRFDVLTFIVSLGIGSIAAIAAFVLYAALEERLWLPLAVGASFGLFSLIFLIGLFLWSCLSFRFSENVLTGKRSSRLVIVILIISCVVISALAGIAQIIYNLSIDNSVSAATSFVFLLDDSGSMDDSDPNNLRYEAMNSLLKESGDSFPYMVYSFSDSTSIVQEMTTVGEGLPMKKNKPYGNTAMKGALQDLIADYLDGKWSNCGAAPKVILLSDGFPTDVGLVSELKSILAEYAKQGITVSTVGLEYADVRLLSAIASKTGGIYCNADDASQLLSAFNSAATESPDRSLLNVRPVVKNDIVYCILRILLVTVLGISISFATIIAYGRHENGLSILVIGAVKSLIAALVLELGINQLLLMPRLSVIVMYVIIALCFFCVGDGESFGRGKRLREEDNINGNSKAVR